VFGAGQAGEVVVEPGEDALVAPGGVVGVDGAVGREVGWEVGPGDAGSVQLQDRVEDVTQVGGSGCTGGPAVGRRPSSKVRTCDPSAGAGQPREILRTL
jgi:hypothetical protein